MLTLPLKTKTYTPQDTPQDTLQDTPQDTNKTIRKEKNKKLLLEFCKEPKTLLEIMKFLGLKDRKNFIEGYVNPMLEEGTLAMTEPDRPTSGNQRYVTVVN